MTSNKNNPLFVVPDNSMELKEAMPLTILGTLPVDSMSFLVYGGPFRKFKSGQRRLVGVRMAEELDGPADIVIPTEDFSVPEVSVMQKGINSALLHALSGYDIYAGCMGGTGRTGTFMACLAKCVSDWNESKGFPGLGDPVAYVRNTYRSHAVETKEQESYCRTFDTVSVVKYLGTLCEPAKVLVEVPVEKVITKTVYPTPLEYMAHLWSKSFGLK